MAPSNEILDPLKRAIRDLAGWLSSAQVPGMLIGGVAASLLGRARATHDVDALVFLPESAWPAFLEQGQLFGFAPRLDDALSFAARSRMLLLVHQTTRIPTDVSLGALPFEIEALQRSAKHDLFGTQVPLPTPEDLIIMKAIPQRPQDLVDIQFLLESHPALDLAHIRKHVRQFSRILGAPELFATLDALLRSKAGVKRTTQTRRARRKEKGP